MATVVLDAKSREKVGTGAARAVRNENFVPGVVYGGNAAPESISVAEGMLAKYVYKSNFLSTVFELNGIGKKGQRYLAKDAQFHPVTDRVLHVDFMRVDEDSRVKLKVPVVFTHEEASPGLKLGGVLNILNRKISVICSPGCIPDKIEVDLTGFAFHNTVHAFGLKLPEGVTLPSKSKDYTIATIIPPSSLKREEAKTAVGAEASAS